MPRVNDVTKRIPFRYSTYQIRRELTTDRIYIVSFGESVGLDRQIHLIYEDGTFDIFHPYDGKDLPENIMLESGKDLFDCFHYMFNNIDDLSPFINVQAEIKRNRHYGPYLKFKDKNNQDIVLRADGKIFINDSNNPIYNTNPFVKSDNLYNLILSEEFYNPVAYLGFY